MAKREVPLPDIGDFEDVDVAEVLVAVGQRVENEQSLVVLESDKASMEIPSPFAGVVIELRVGVGDQVNRGDVIAILEVGDDAPAEAEPEEAPEPEPASKSEPAAAAREPAPTPEPAPKPAPERPPERAAAPAADDALPPHASPSVRRLARELGADLGQVSGSGNKGRITKEDVHAYAKQMIQRGSTGGSGLALPPAPEIDFAKFGPIESQPLNRIRKLSASNLHRAWLTVPHVTQHDEADISELDRFRKEMAGEAQARGTKLTFLPFVIKACTHALAEFPHFNASLDPSGENLILKRYFHIGVAVDTPNGLIVPVVRDANQKGLFDLADELSEISEKARSRKLGPGDLQGGTFSISSLGGLGGTFFTPIVNHPEVAILGVGKMDWRPVYRDGEFVPRRVLPLSLSYDHRVIDGADAARFTSRLSQLLSDLRRLIL